MKKNKLLEEFYLIDLEKNCNFAIYAYETAFYYLKVHEVEKFWFYIQSFLINSANVSKILFNENRKSDNIKKIKKKLKKMLNIDEKSILKNRSLRNHFEHFDERLEQHVYKNQLCIFIDKNISPINNFIRGIEKELYLRHYDNIQNILYFKGESYNLKNLYTEIITIKKRIKNYPKNGLA